jgi:hypothetical protein
MEVALFAETIPGYGDDLVYSARVVTGDAAEH